MHIYFLVGMGVPRLGGGSSQQHTTRGEEWIGHPSPTFFRFPVGPLEGIRVKPPKTSSLTCQVWSRKPIDAVAYLQSFCLVPGQRESAPQRVASLIDAAQLLEQSAANEVHVRIALRIDDGPVVEQRQAGRSAAGPCDRKGAVDAHRRDGALVLE